MIDQVKTFSDYATDDYIGVASEEMWLASLKAPKGILNGDDWGYPGKFLYCEGEE